MEAGALPFPRAVLDALETLRAQTRRYARQQQQWVRNRLASRLVPVVRLGDATTALEHSLVALRALAAKSSAGMRNEDLAAAGLEPLQVACELTLDSGVITGAVVMNELRRLVAPNRPEVLEVPDRLQLQTEPLADCARYDALRGGAYVLH